MWKMVAGCLFCVSQCLAHLPTQKETAIYRERLDAKVLPKCLSLPEGGFAYYYHPRVEKWLESPLSADLLREIETLLQPSLEIPFTKEGFTQAVAKPEGDQFGEVSYSAVWVRDCCWHYYGLKIHQPDLAEKLMLSLLKFYSSPAQISRFLSIIEKPELADPGKNPSAHMKVPLIRFSSKSLSHHQFEGKDQEWNHLQFDSHGLFLLALSDAISSGILSPTKLQTQDFAVISLFPAFFTQTNYAQKGDAGPWEEGLQLNASSAGLVASGVKRVMEVFFSNSELSQGLSAGVKSLKVSSKVAGIIESSMSKANIDKLYSLGLERVNRNLAFGGEAPNLDGKGIDRRADAALFFLCLVPHTPFFDQPQKVKEILNINASLIGPYGIYRYRYDPYQTLNYWIDFDVLSPISGAKTPIMQVLSGWKKGYMPHRQPSDAQWFFDSCFADVYYHLSMQEKEPLGSRYYLRQGDLHLKRALAQLTGPDAVAANGAPLEPLQLPESINSVFDGFYSTRPLPSPIAPLSWAKASMQMALSCAIEAHTHVESRQK